MSKSEKNSKPINNRKIFEIILTIVLIVVCVFSLAASGILIYTKKYLSRFWVNGQSMYPTLNRDATHFDGSSFGIGGGGISGDGAKNLDYGLMDEHESAKKKIKRFDILVCLYASDDPSDKIKRVLGMPGETIKFDTSFTTSRGELSVKQSDGSYKVVDQPIDKEYINSASAYYPAGEITLASDEYFVCGDNRAHSSDSRGNGSKQAFGIKKDWVVGVVVAIVGKCEAHYNSESEDYEISDIKYKWPRFF